MRVWFTWAGPLSRASSAVWFQAIDRHAPRFETQGDTFVATAPKAWLAEVENLPTFLVLGVEE